ncbi:MAG: hypothetical protein HOO01_05710 [Cellvibrionales bacterium]|nr:hypothetical protein [Cellvibrionales bacterium]
MSNDNELPPKSLEPSDDLSVLDHRAMVKEQAAVWLIRISDNALTSAEVVALREWIGRSDFHREYFIQLSQNWDDMAVLQELAVLFSVPRARASAGIGWVSFFTDKLSFSAVAVAASVLVCAFALLLLTLPVEHSRIMALQTAIGEQRVETLNDGSVLTINTDSQLTVDYSGDNRIIHLTRGEVNFDVSKDPHRPFVVYAGDGLVWAVGTAFNVRLASGGVDLTVTEGRVKVYAGIASSESLPTLAVNITNAHNASVSLQPNEAFVKAGEALRYSQVIAEKDEVQTERLMQKLAWQQGALIFKGETLEQALVEIRRYTHMELRIVDPNIKNKKVGGYYKTDDIDGLLRSMSQSFDIHMAYLENNVVHLSSK